MAKIATMRKWSPALAERWCVSRIDRVEHLLREIAYAWGDVDNGVVMSCDRLIDELKDLREAVAEAKEQELQREPVA